MPAWPSVIRTAAAALGVVGAGGGADFAVAGAPARAPGRECGQLVGVVLQVPAVAQEGERDAGLLEERLGGLVLGGQLHAGGVRVRDAGVGEQFHAFVLGGLDHGPVLRHALADGAGGNQQDPVRARERPGDRFGVVVVHGFDLDPAAGEVSQFLGGASDGDDLVGGYAALQERGDDVAAQLAGGSGDDDAHGKSFQVFVLFRKGQQGRLRRTSLWRVRTLK